MKFSPDVSVVMSVYNAADVLAETLDSVLNQEHCALEFIVVNDGSSDGTGSILDDYAERDDRLRVIHQANSGLTHALIRGCAEASGEFIARQDAGDLSLPLRLTKQLEAIQADPQIAFVSCSTRCVGPKREFLLEWKGSGMARLPIGILDVTMPHGVLDGPACHPSVMFRRSSYLRVGGYRSEFYFGQDWDLWYRLAEVGLFELLPEVLYEARIGLSDISTSNKKTQEALARLSEHAMRLRMSGCSDHQILRLASELRPKAGKGNSHAWRVSHSCYFVGECLRRNGNRREARRYLWTALRANPINFRAAIRLLQTLFS